ncbi:hypothetical protein GCM10010429_33010 [Micromonospora olivasterospora]
MRRSTVRFRQAAPSEAPTSMPAGRGLMFIYAVWNRLPKTPGNACGRSGSACLRRGCLELPMRGYAVRQGSVLGGAWVRMWHQLKSLSSSRVNGSWTGPASRAAMTDEPFEHPSPPSVAIRPSPKPANWPVACAPGCCCWPTAITPPPT